MKTFIVVDVMSLRVALHHEMCLVLGHHLMLILLHLEHPLHPDWHVIRWEINGALGVILFNERFLLHHCLPLVSYPGSKKQNRSLHTCAQDVQITRMATI
jgi:hypothetical protein